MKIQIEKPLLRSLTLMASMIEARDAYTGGHLWRVSQYSRRLAEAAGLPTEMIFLARLGGFLHDIGKISIPGGPRERSAISGVPIPAPPPRRGFMTDGCMTV